MFTNLRLLEVAKNWQMKDWHSPRQSDSLRDVSAYARKCAVEFDVTESWLCPGPSDSQCLLLLRDSKIDIVLNIKHNTEGTTVNPLPGPALSIDIQLSSLWKSSTSALQGFVGPLQSAIVHEDGVRTTLFDVVLRSLCYLKTKTS